MKTKPQKNNELEELRRRLLEAEDEIDRLKRLLEKAEDRRQHMAAERRRASQQQKLAESASAILAALNLTELWTALTTAAQETLAADRLAVFVHNANTNRLTCIHASGLPADYLGELAQQFHDGFSSQLLRDKQPVVVQDVQTDLATATSRRALTEDLRTYAVLPLAAPKGMQGMLAVYRDASLPFSADDLTAGQTLAHIAAVALQNSHLFAEMNQALLREQRLNELSLTLSTTQDLPTILSRVIQMVTELVNADAGLLGLVIDGQIMTFYPYNVSRSINLRPMPKGRGLAWHIATTLQSLKLSHYSDHPQAHPDWGKAGITTYLGAPLAAADTCLGALELFNFSPDKEFSARDLALAESVGRQAGIAIQNVHIMAALQQRANALTEALARQEELDLMKTQFIQNVSHELRTPLGIIYGHAELLDSGDLGELQSEQQVSVQIIARRARMLNDVVDDFTALIAAETQELRRERIEPAQLIASMLADFEMKAEQAGLTLTAEVADNLPPLLGDDSHLRRLFDNLMSNAFKFTPAGGRITITAWRDGMDTIIEVSDTGVGIAPEKLAHIFERFYQVDATSTRRHLGAGLGLALVKEIVEAHRGSVSARSQEGEGTTFSIRLPGIRE